MAKPTDCQYKLVSLFDITLGFYLRMCNLLVTVLLLYPEAANQYLTFAFDEYLINAVAFIVIVVF